MARATLIDLNPVEFNYFPSVISLDECSGSRNAVEAISTKKIVKKKET